ncbi:hypothetical protein TNCV_2206161 [Trichonephila clavipes]|nr:hypothetical protein TNCV_2206161 [Trichonephila clavipes]
MTLELAPLLLTTTPHQREDVWTLNGFNVHRSSAWQVFNGTGLELVTSQPRSDTLTTRLPWPPTNFVQNLPSESSDALTDDSSDKEVPANSLLEFSLHS